MKRQSQMKIYSATVYVNVCVCYPTDAMNTSTLISLQLVSRTVHCPVHYTILCTETKPIAILFLAVSGNL